jgi:hypothetical protein
MKLAVLPRKLHGHRFGGQLGSREMRKFLREFFDTYGFRLFARGYSHYTDTQESLPNLVNFASEPVQVVITSGASYDLASNDVKDAGLFDRWLRADAQGNCYTWRSSDNGDDDQLDPRDLLAQSYLVSFLRHVRQNQKSQLQGKRITFGDGSRLQLLPTLYGDLERQNNPAHPTFA